MLTAMEGNYLVSQTPQSRTDRTGWIPGMLILLGIFSFVLPSVFAASAPPPKVYFSDTSRLGRPFAKDPSVVRFRGRYWMYYSMPSATEELKGSDPRRGVWGIGIARSTDLFQWTKVGEMLPEGEVEQKGIAAPGARVIRGKLHLFYQTYGGGRTDAICHATSSDGIHFVRDTSNPVFRATGMTWSAGRAIDAEVFPYHDELWLFFATRDPAMKVQQLGMAAALLQSDFSRTTWQDRSTTGPILKPVLSWEQDCIEAPSVLRHGKLYYLFYAGAYNNAPQQIGVATSPDGKTWTRMSDQPLLTNGQPGSWNSSESGHPGVLTDRDGKTYMFFQGNNDHGQTWFISMKKIEWKGSQPVLSEP